ncbi:hypothetical protein [Rhizobium rosettiformans]|nr:hypothetical protein [Rhizobium rosettiformans]MDR7030952.1 hypothetical protein [Rhizobium rosettiformans]MDR7066829.1 hypothetical protein [Rhizobium rosettiformans]
MMSISTHDRVQGRPFRVRSLERFLDYALKHKGVVCLRKDQIANFALNEPSIVRDVNPHDEWAAWERQHGNQKIAPID